ncbi:MAG: SDR family NAD(P)-dependent oxidoreductase, partial [Solirubrobacterales bacterium]
MGDSLRSEIFREGLLEDQVIVVSGAGSGLGRATALELARLGATVIGCGRRTEPLEETGKLIEGLPGGFESSGLDIRDDDGVDSFFDGVLERHGRIDTLVNNAGGQFLSPAEAISPKGFRTVIELNVTGTWLMTHAAATKAFIPQGGGAVISVTLSPHNGMPGMVHSGAARAAVENMTRTLATEWSRFGIRTCAIAAGQFATDTFVNKYPKEIVESVHRTIPMGRVGES